VNLASIYDLIILIVVSIVVYIFAFRKKITRWMGVVMVAFYVADTMFAIYR